MAAHFNLNVASVSKFATSMVQACSLGFCTPALGDGWYG
jgi:hypothetical protein